MSRSFTFPPPGYVKNGLSGDDLLHWMMREREKAKIERARARKEQRKAKKNEKGEKANSKNNTHARKGKGKATKREKENPDNTKGERNGEKRPRTESNNVNVKQDCVNHTRGSETDHLEKSDVTEEHEEPNYQMGVYESSDNTQNSKKRKMHNPDYCSMDYPKVFSTGKSSSLPGRKEIISEDKAHMEPMQEHSRRTDMELDLQWRDLLKNCLPQLQFELTDVDDMEWLFRNKPRHLHEEKKFKPCFDALHYGSANLWPRACYLPEIGVYALPYTIPY